MPKALELTDDAMTPPPVPKAAQTGTPSAEAPKVPKKDKADDLKEPLQVRWPGKEVKAAKIASLQLGFQTVSDFMLACFHAYMKQQEP